MFTYKGGQRAGKGTYWDLRNGRRFDIADEAALPGDDAITYFRMPVWIMLLSGPFIGLAFVVLLPFIGIVTVAAFGGRRLLEATANLVGKTFSFGWRPKNAYLAGKKKDKGGKKQ